VLLLLWNGLQAITHRPEPSLAANTNQAAQTTPQARYDYDPYAYDINTGRWLSRDPAGEDVGPNLYEYCFDEGSLSKRSHRGLEVYGR
jgi:RHS repeat-associated protein